jgi:metal-responsive CopG/Arc/MetJ family transcriptional regulator
MPASPPSFENTACEELHISIPCELAKRIQHYTRESGSELSQVIVEALDTFLRRQNK